MELLECLATIATKLGLSHEQIVVLYAYNRSLLGKLGVRTAYSILSDLVDRFELRDDADAPSYGSQLVTKGILTEAEGYLFTEGYLLNAAQSQKHAESGGEDGPSDTFDGKA